MHFAQSALSVLFFKHAVHLALLLY